MTIATCAQVPFIKRTVEEVVVGWPMPTWYDISCFALNSDGDTYIDTVPLQAPNSNSEFQIPNRDSRLPTPTPHGLWLYGCMVVCMVVWLAG